MRCPASCKSGAPGEIRTPYPLVRRRRLRASVLVYITNASKTKMSERRMKDTLHERYSGYPGGQKFDTNEKIVKKKGWKGLYELAVYGMLPDNKLRPLMMKRLTNMKTETVLAVRPWEILAKIWPRQKKRLKMA